MATRQVCGPFQKTGTARRQCEPLLAAGMRWGARPAFPRESVRTCLLVFREAVIMLALLFFYNTRLVAWTENIGLPF